MDESNTQEVAAEPVVQDQEAVVDDSTQDVNVETADESTLTSGPEPAEQSAAVEPEEDEVNLFAQYRDQITEAPQVDINRFINENGEFDAASYNAEVNQVLKQTMQQTIAASTSQVRMESEYKTQWDKAVEKYPELKDNPKLRNMVQAIHVQSVESDGGKNYLSPLKAAQELFGIRNEGKQAGVKAATESRKLQASAHLGSSSAPTVQTNQTQSAKDRMMSAPTAQGRQEARQEYLASLIEQGKI